MRVGKLGRAQITRIDSHDRHGMAHRMASYSENKTAVDILRWPLLRVRNRMRKKLYVKLIGAGQFEWCCRFSFFELMNPDVIHVCKRKFFYDVYAAPIGMPKRQCGVAPG